MQAIGNFQVGRLAARGNRTKGGKVVRNPKAYIFGGLRKTGIKKFGAAGFKARMVAGRRRAR
jgi:hypothetical protein